MPEPSAHANRLAAESSPYLLQHAANPVEWWPWCDEAFEAARRRDVPVFISIGYSTCYWCHVMERESFESERIADRLNASFVCIKVDREQRPEIDELYMTATQLMTGRGGWPMSVFVEPDSRRPFYCGTYFPAEPRLGVNVPTFDQILMGIDEAWQGKRHEVIEQAGAVAESVRERIGQLHEPVRIGDAQVGRAISDLLCLHDPSRGGFGQGAPKFPQCVYPQLLLKARPFVDEQTRTAIDGALKRTLDAMSLGGIHDHVGGGFHRYSVDERWLVPHFEKMLYDQAQLGALYARAADVYEDAWYARTARRLFAYLAREMTLEGGAFCAAQDAEVNHREGQNYVWTPEQLDEALDGDDAAFAAKVFGVGGGGNFTDPHHPEDGPVTVLALADRPERLAGRFSMSTEAFIERLDDVCDKMLVARDRRDQPMRDDTVIRSWNALMIGTLRQGAKALADRSLAETAARAEAFLDRTLVTADGAPARSWRHDRIGPEATLEDVAATLLAREDAAEADGLLAHAEAAFGAPDGGWYDASASRDDLFVRARLLHDGAIPSGHALMARALVRLAHQSAEKRYAERCARTLTAASAFISASPVGSAGSTLALLHLLAIDRGAIERALDDAGASAPPEGAQTAPDDAVQILASVASVSVGQDHPVSLTLRVRIAEGHVIYGAEPIAPGAEAPVEPVAFRVDAIGGSGVRVYADYPEASAHKDDPSLRVLRGEFDLPVVIEREGQWGGTPLIGLTYQVCTDDGTCYLPRTVELDVAIDRM